ncbi:MAG TPA: hypothetical protein VFS88_03535 [Micavibrio sp.]|nr:hypothetical protein [Micavibrio sp.]
MLSGHPNIKTIRVSEIYERNQLRRRLVIDTDLVMPSSGRIEENDKLLALHDYLEHIAVNDFADFDEVEIRTPRHAPMKSYDRMRAN